MSRINANARWLTTALLAASLVGCGAIQGATPGRAGVQMNGGSGDVHLTEFDANDTPRTSLEVSGGTTGDTSSGPALVP